MVVDSGCVLFPSMKAKLLAPATVFTKNMMEKKKTSEQNCSFLVLSTQTAHSNRCFFPGISS